MAGASIGGVKRMRDAGRGRRATLGVGVLLALAALVGGCVAVPEEAMIEIAEPPSRPSAPLLLRLATIPQDGAVDCGIEVSSVWTPAPNDAGVYMIEGESAGETCQAATLSIAIRAPNGRVLWRDQLGRARVYGFGEALEPDRMRGRLIDWITAHGKLTRTTKALPEWPEGAAAPDVGAGNPFFPAEGLQRDTYETLRLAGRPLYCYVSGADYLNCLALSYRSGDVIYLGAQTFKG